MTSLPPLSTRKISRHNLLVLSDVHLGSDLVQHSRPNAPLRGKNSLLRDRDFVRLLKWYQRNRRGGLPWRLIIAGDFVDFIGMSVPALRRGHIKTSLTPEEHEHGLGSAEDHARAKLELVLRHHRGVFRALARFVADGNTLVVLRGNHDVDLHWESVQGDFVRCLQKFAPVSRDEVEFAPWFYYERDVVYVEHGHQYDHFCSQEHLLHPVNPRDRRRLSQSVTDVLLRYIVRPTQGMLEAGHDRAGFLDYVRFATRLGFGGAARLGQRFTFAVVEMMRIYRAQFSEAAAWIQREHERKMKLLGDAKHISVERLRALARLQKPPVTQSLVLILASVMLDRVAVALLSLSAVIAVAIRTDSWQRALLFSGIIALIASIAAVAWRKVRGSLDASADLRNRAPLVLQLFPAAFIVMGHTHMPEVSEAAPNQTYVNLGAWAEEDATDGGPSALPATRTHLVLECQGEVPVGELLRWGEDAPEVFITGNAEAPSRRS